MCRYIEAASVAKSLTSHDTHMSTTQLASGCHKARQLPKKKKKNEHHWEDPRLSLNTKGTQTLCASTTHLFHLDEKVEAIFRSSHRPAKMKRSLCGVVKAKAVAIILHTHQNTIWSPQDFYGRRQIWKDILSSGKYEEGAASVLYFQGPHRENLSEQP